MSMEFDITLWQERQLDDEILHRDFIFLWQNNEYQEALNLLRDNAQLDKKKFVAGVLNTISAALTYLQNNYFENVEDELTIRLEEFHLAITKFKNELEYNPSKQYYTNNFVWYEDEYYICIEDCLGILPTDEDYWVLIGLKGEKGSSGTGLILRYSWNLLTEYVQYDVVYLDGVLYVALQDNLGQNPVSATAYWQVFMEVPFTSITLGEPIDPYVGQIWANVLD